MRCLEHVFTQMSGVQVLRIEVFILQTKLTSMQQSLAWTNILHLCHLSKTVFLKVRSDCAFCNRYDGEDVFAHEMAYHISHVK